MALIIGIAAGIHNYGHFLEDSWFPIGLILGAAIYIIAKRKGHKNSSAIYALSIMVFVPLMLSLIAGTTEYIRISQYIDYSMIILVITAIMIFCSLYIFFTTKEVNY